MSGHAMLRVLVGATVAFIIAAMITIRRAAPGVRVPPAAIQRASELGAIALPESLSRAAATVIEHDPFRLDRRPASVPYQPVDRRQPATVTSATPARPKLVLAGIVGGPPWKALLDGAPGREETVVVGAGDTLGGLRVQAVSRTTVTILGPDTSWSLSIQRAW